MAKLDRILIVAALALATTAFVSTRGLTIVSTAEAQSSSDQTQGPIAHVAGWSILTDLLQSERFRPELEALQEEMTEAMQPLQDQMQGLTAEFQGAQQEGNQARLGEIQQEAQALQAEMQSIQQSFQGRIESLQRDNLQEAWEEIRAAADAVAEEAGYTYVFMAEDPTDNLNTDGIDQDNDGRTDQPIEEMRRRYLIVTPEGADLTADVRADLNLD